MWRNKEIKIKWSDFFEVTPNKIKVFKLVPHTNLSNQQNRHMWNSLHKAYGLYHDMHKRINVNWKPFKLSYRTKDLLFFDVVFRTDPHKIEFYFSTTETMAKKFKVILENKWNVSLKDAEMTDLEIPVENTDIYEIRYEQHDIFSLSTNATHTTTPISSVLSSVEEMENGDFARIQFQLEREGNKKWFYNSSWAYKKIKKGVIPQRPKVNGKRGIHAIKRGIVSVGNEILTVFTDVLNAFNNVFSPNNKGFEKKKIGKPVDMISEIQGASLSDRTHKKIKEGTVWKTHMRVAIHSPSKFNRDNTANVITSSYKELDENNQLKAYKIRWKGIDIKIRGLHIKKVGRKTEIIKEMNSFIQSKRTRHGINPNIVSSDELGRLIQLPGAELQRNYKNELESNSKVQASIPKLFIHDSFVNINGIKIRIGSNKIKLKDKVIPAKENGVLIGHTEYKGENSPVCLPIKNPDEFYKTYMLLGAQGMGKDTFLQNFVVESNLKHNVSFVIFDQIDEEGDRGLANGVRDCLPAERIIDIDISNPNYTFPFDMSEIINKLGEDGPDRFADDRAPRKCA